MASSAKETIKQGIRDLVQGGNVTQYSKDFFDFVKQIGDARTKQDEDRIIQNEIRTLKAKMSAKDLQQKNMREYLIRMLYVEMLGHDASFGHIHAVNLVSSRDLLAKRIGYLAVCLTLHKDHQLMILLVNAFQTDLKSDNYLEVCMALHAVTKLCSADFIPAVLPHVLQLLTHKQAIVRKKAVLCLQRFYQLQSSSISGLNELILKALCDPDPAVMSSALLVLKEIIPQSISEFKMIIPSLVTILKQIIEHRLPREYDYHRIPAPWIQMNILHLLSILCHGDRKSSELVFDLLADVLKRAAISSNIGYSIVYQCIRTITNIYPNTALLKSAAEAVSFFLGSPYNNLKYLGLTSLAAIIKIDPVHAADHQLIVIDCLQSRDETLQHKTLELLYHMTNPTNVIAIVDTMMKHLRSTANSQFRTFLSLQILDLCDLYAPSGAWYVLTVSQLYEIGGDDIPTHKSYSVINFMTSLIDETDDDNVEIRKGLTNEFISKLQAADTTVTSTNNTNNGDNTVKQGTNNNVMRIPENLMKTIAWVLGEFSIMSGYDGQDVIDLLSTRLIQTYVDSSVRHWILRAIMRVISQLPQTTKLSETTIHIINNAKQSQDVILQQIAEEMSSLYQHRAFLQHVLIQPTLSLQVDKTLSFLNPLVQRALQSGACGEYIPDYLSRHSGLQDKQTKSGLRFEAYAKATPLVRIQPVHTTTPSTQQQVVSNTAHGMGQQGNAGSSSDANKIDSNKINLKIGGAKGSWGPKGFNNPNVLKTDQVQQQQGGFSQMTTTDATLQPTHIQSHSSNQQTSFMSTAKPDNIGSTNNMFSGMIKPKPRPGDVAAQQAQEEKKQQAAKGLFAGLTPKPTNTPMKQQVRDNNGPEYNQQHELAPEAKKFTFKSGVTIKKVGGNNNNNTSSSSTTTPQQTQQQTQQTVNLFDVGNNNNTTTSKPTSQQTTPSSNNLDIFDFGATPSKPTPTTTSNNNTGGVLDMFDFGSTPSKPSQTPSKSTTNNDFDLFSTLGGSSTETKPTTNNNTNTGGFDMFNFGDNSSSTTTSTSPTTSNTSQNALSVGFSSNMTTLQQTLVKLGSNSNIQSIPLTPLPTNNSTFTISSQNCTNAIVIWISNTNISTRYASQSVKIQIQSPFAVDINQSILIDHTSQQTVKASQQGSNITFTHTTSPQGLGSITLVLLPSQSNNPTPATIQFAVGTTTIAASNFYFPLTPTIIPLPIQTKQYAELWKSFGTTGEYKMTVNGTNINTPDVVPPILQKANIHAVQTIKQETIAAAVLYGHGVADMNDFGVLLHVKVLGDGSISLHCRSKWSVQAAQQFVETFAQFVQGKL